MSGNNCLTCAALFSGHCFPASTPVYRTGFLPFLPAAPFAVRHPRGLSRKHPSLSNNPASLSDTFSSFTQYLALRTQHFFSMEPTHLSNTASQPVMENTRGIWSAAAEIGEFGDNETIFQFHHSYHSYHFHRFEGKRFS
jgi:hypothetical protein